MDLNRLAELYIGLLKSGGDSGELFHADVAYEIPGVNGKGVSGFVAENERVQRLYPLLKPLRVFIDAEEICVVTEASSADSSTEPLRIVDWIQVRDRRIAAVSRVFDSKPVDRSYTEI